MKLKSIPRRLGYILGAQWTRDLSWTLFTILLSRQDPFLLGQIMLALGYGYLVKTAADVGLNEFLLSSFARRDARPTVLLGEVLWLKCALLVIALGVTWCIVASKANYSPELRLIVLCIAAGFGIDGISDLHPAVFYIRAGGQTYLSQTNRSPVFPVRAPFPASLRCRPRWPPVRAPSGAIPLPVSAGGSFLIWRSACAAALFLPAWPPVPCSTTS